MDASIPQDNQLLIHEVKQLSGGSYRGYLIRNLATASRAPATSLNANGVTISLVSTSGNLATVRIQSYFAKKCKTVGGRQGACCHPGAPRLVPLDGPAAPAAPVLQQAECCCAALQGYVWRNACYLDFVCVTPTTRTQVEADNNAQASRVAKPGTYTCITGYVWREACGSIDRVGEACWRCSPGARERRL